MTAPGGAVRRGPARSAQERRQSRARLAARRGWRWDPAPVVAALALALAFWIVLATL
jgi:hypothetical protein